MNGKLHIFGYVLLVSLAAQGRARAATWFVDASAPGGDGTSWAQAFIDLQQALSEPSLAFGDQIWVAAGTYAPGASQTDTFQLVAGVEVYGGFPAGGGDGTFAARDPDPATNGTVLSGNLAGGATAFVIVTGPPNDEFAILDGFTVTGASQHAIFNSNSKATYANLLITGNQSFGEGAGMRNESNSKPSVTACTFTGNDAFNGGAMSNNGLGTDPVVTNCAFTSNRAGDYNIYMMKADGSSVTQLTTDPATDQTAAFSPDGTRIAFATARDGNLEVYAMRADGTGKTRLTNNNSQDGRPVYSHDGTKIAYTSIDESLGPPDIWIMNADGSGQTNLTNDPSWDDFPAFAGTR